MEYQLIEENTCAEFEAVVNGRIKQGWEPLGGIDSGVNKTDDGEVIWYAQAMVKK